MSGKGYVLPGFAFVRRCDFAQLPALCFLFLLVFQPINSWEQLEEDEKGQLKTPSIAEIQKQKKKK
jgi:hypothetical protein